MEPETHSFPPYTRYLGELISLNDRGKQFFIVTHNPYLLGSILSKTPENELAVFVANQRGQSSSLTRVSSEQLPEALESEVDIFFNLKNSAP